MKNLLKTIILVLLLFVFHQNTNAQELIGPNRIKPGSLAVYEIDPPQEAAWLITPVSSMEVDFIIDTSGTKICFASTLEGTFSVIAAIANDGKPQILSITVMNLKDDSKPIPPGPGPPADSLDTWVRKNSRELVVESHSFETEKNIVVKCFSDTSKRIENRSILTTQNALTQLQLCLRNNLARSSNTAITDWSVFLEKLGHEIEKSLGDNRNDIKQIQKAFQVVQSALEDKS